MDKERYYIYCSNNLAYHTLWSNSILAKSVTKPDFQEESISFLSKDYIFVTKRKLDTKLKNIGVKDQYYPVTLEIEDAKINSNIPAQFATLDENGVVTLSNIDGKLSDYANYKNCIGAFILGEIPITYLSGILFDSDEHKIEFKKSSPDLWFPDDLFTIPKDSDFDTTITESMLVECAEKITQSIQEEKILEIRKLIKNRIRYKAALYYGIDATTDWMIDPIKTNVDSTLMQVLDDEVEHPLKKIIEHQFSAMPAANSINITQYLETRDEILDLNPDSSLESKRLFKNIIQFILDKTDMGGEITPELMEQLRTSCIEIGDDKDKIKSAIDTVQRYLASTNMDPDTTLESIKAYPVLRSLMIFLDQQNNAGFMRNATIKLTQNEKRYTYLMFGFLNGMAGTERPQKSNRHKEYRLEEVVFKKYPSDKLINKLLPANELTFIKSDPLNIDQNKVVYGIEVKVICRNGKQRSRQILKDQASSEDLEKLYSLWNKTNKNKQIPENEVYHLNPPITITIEVGENKGSVALSSESDLANFKKKNDKLIKPIIKIFDAKIKTGFDAAAFKKHLDDMEYNKFYDKNEDEIERICTKALI